MSLSIAPRTSVKRPELPLQHANPHILTTDSTKPPTVKYQIITREGHDIIVGRIKVATPDGHAFVLRRFDTNAVSLTTMFRAAFPSAPEQTEKDECSWIKSNYDISTANGGSGDNAAKLRLAGTWVPPDVAIAVADSYSLTTILNPLITAVPEANIDYRKSTKTATSSPAAVTPATKRSRHEASPAPSSPASPAQPPLRRSSRQKSPAPKAALAATSTKPKSKKQSIVTPIVTDNTTTEDDEAEVPGPDMSADVAEQKALIERLKAEKAAGGIASSRAEKRKAAEESPLTLNLDREPEVDERTIATNRRIRGIEMTPQRKSVAWGAGLFSAGLGAFYFAAQYFPQFTQSFATL